LATKPLDETRLRQTYELVTKLHSIQAAATQVGVARSTMKSRWDAAKRWAAKHGKPIISLSITPQHQQQQRSVDDALIVDGDHGTLTRLTAFRITTLKQLVAVCEIDEKEWDIVGYECGVYETGMRPLSTTVWDLDAQGKPTKKMWVREQGDPIIAQLFRVAAKMRRRSPFVKSLDSLHKELIADIKASVKGRPVQAPKMARSPASWLYEFPPVDLHLGKLTWSDETVTNYDTDMAEELARAALESLLTQALKVTDGKLSQIIYLIGNDAMHSDNRKNQTTSGTPMDVDTRYPKVYRRLVRFTRWSLDRLREVAPVHGVVMPGNHDAESAFHLGELLAATYEHTKYVTIDNRPRPRKYYDWGVNLWGFAHGHNEKVTELPNLMAREVAGYLGPGVWDRCTSREWHIGHKHIAEAHAHRLEQDLFSDKGVRVRRLMSLSAHDAWHTEHGYADRRGCDAFVFHKTAGMAAHLLFNVDHFSGKPLEAK
jgi:hypothetical protein